MWQWVYSQSCLLNNEVFIQILIVFIGTFLPPVFVYAKKQTVKAEVVKPGEADYVINMHNVYI